MARSMTHRLLLGISALGLFVGLVGVHTPAGAVGTANRPPSVRAAGAPVCVADAAGDNGWGYDPRGDIRTYCSSDDGTTITASLSTASFDDPSASYNWRAYPLGDPNWLNWTQIVFSLDTDADATPEYDVWFYWSPDSESVISQVTPFDKPETVLCDATPSWNAGSSTYTSAIPASCVGNPASVAVTAYLYYETADTVSQDATSFISNACTGHEGYWLLGRDGGVFSFGTAPFYGSTGNLRLNQPVVGMASARDASGYWFVASDGGVFAYGAGSPFYGSTGAIRLNKPVIGMAARPQGDGYWLVASDGGIFAFGGAQFYGSTGAMTLNQPIVGMASTPTGKGYWLVARDGGIFSFGDAKFYGSTGAIRLSQPIVGMSSVPDGQGYWLVAGDGGIFAFGPNAHFYGSIADGQTTNVIGMHVAAFTDGYRMASSTGGVASLNAPNCGSLSGQHLNAPIVAIETANSPL